MFYGKEDFINCNCSQFLLFTVVVNKRSVDGGFDNNELEYEETHKIVRLAVDAILMAEGTERKEHMGIKGLTKLLADNVPKAMKEQKLESYFGRKIA
ncbi:hypothetical protein Gotur_022155, partial [Gossypium turneri]